MDILSHVLVSPNVTRVACGKNRTPLLAPDTIVVHYTGGGDARSSALYLADPATKASAHVVIARDGQVFQLVPFNVRAWHAGVSALEGRTNVNAFSFGIELANAGRLTRRDDRWFTWFGDGNSGGGSLYLPGQGGRDLLACLHAFAIACGCPGLPVAGKVLSGLPPCGACRYYLPETGSGTGIPLGSLSEYGGEFAPPVKKRGGKLNESGWQRHGWVCYVSHRPRFRHA